MRKVPFSSVTSQGFPSDCNLSWVGKSLHGGRNKDLCSQALIFFFSFFFSFPLHSDFSDLSPACLPIPLLHLKWNDLLGLG